MVSIGDVVVVVIAVVVVLLTVEVFVVVLVEEVVKDSTLASGLYIFIVSSNPTAVRWVDIWSNTFPLLVSSF